MFSRGTARRSAYRVATTLPVRVASLTTTRTLAPVCAAAWLLPISKVDTATKDAACARRRRTTVRVSTAKRFIGMGLYRLVASNRDTPFGHADRERDER